MPSYLSFGLIICSDFPCPELFPAFGPPDVYFRIGEVAASVPLPSSSDSAICQAKPGLCLLHIPGVARYRVSNGVEITVDPDPAAEFDAVRLFLMSTCIGALLLQRGMLPLHASAVAGTKGAAVFTGISGAGKSTLAAALYQRGFRVLADDICRIAVTPQLSVIPANPYLMLWADSLEALSFSPHDLTPVRSELPKFRLMTQGFQPEAIPVSAVYVMSTVNSNELSLTPVSGLQKIDLLTRFTFRRSLVDRMSLAVPHLVQVAQLAGAVRVVSVIRPRKPIKLQELADMIVADMQT